LAERAILIFNKLLYCLASELGELANTAAFRRPILEDLRGRAKSADLEPFQTPAGITSFCRKLFVCAYRTFRVAIIVELNPWSSANGEVTVTGKLVNPYTTSLLFGFG
jgi:hypothetical protein